MDTSMEIPCTQVLDDVLPDDSPQSSPDKKKEVGVLKINNINYAIFIGENRIGRNPETCSIVLDGKAVSTEHAVIAAHSSDSFFVWDLKSTNKTRLNKVILEPHVRYEIRDGAELCLADVRAAFCKLSKPSVINESIDSSKEGDFLVPETPAGHEFRKPAERKFVVESPSDDSIIECSQPTREEKIFTRIPDGSIISSTSSLESNSIRKQIIFGKGTDETAIGSMSEAATQDVCISENSDTEKKKADFVFPKDVSKMSISDTVNDNRLNICDEPTQCFEIEGPAGKASPVVNGENQEGNNVSEKDICSMDTQMVEEEDNKPDIKLKSGISVRVSEPVVKSESHSDSDTDPEELFSSSNSDKKGTQESDSSAIDIFNCPTQLVVEESDTDKSADNTVIPAVKNRDTEDSTEVVKKEGVTEKEDGKCNKLTDPDKTAANGDSDTDDDIFDAATQEFNNSMEDSKNEEAKMVESNTCGSRAPKCDSKIVASSEFAFIKPDEKRVNSDMVQPLVDDAEDDCDISNAPTQIYDHDTSDKQVGNTESSKNEKDISEQSHFVESHEDNGVCTGPAVGEVESETAAHFNPDEDLSDALTQIIEPGKQSKLETNNNKSDKSQSDPTALKTQSPDIRTKSEEFPDTDLEKDGDKSDSDKNENKTDSVHQDEIDFSDLPTQVISTTKQNKSLASTESKVPENDKVSADVPAQNHSTVCVPVPETIPSQVSKETENIKDISEAPTQIIGKIEQEQEPNDTVDGDIGDLPTQIINSAKAHLETKTAEDIDDIGGAPTQVIKGRQETAENIDDIGDAPTQVIKVRPKAAEDIDDISDAPTQVIKGQPKAADDIDDIGDLPTQVINNAKAQKETMRAEDIDDIGDAPTQIIKGRPKTVVDVEDIGDAPTQVIKERPKTTEDDEGIGDAPTQIIGEGPKTAEKINDIGDAPTQVISDTVQQKQPKSAEDIEDVGDAPAQIISDTVQQKQPKSAEDIEDVGDAPTQVISDTVQQKQPKAAEDAEDISDAVTQFIESTEQEKKIKAADNKDDIVDVDNVPIRDLQSKSEKPVREYTKSSMKRKENEVRKLSSGAEGERNSKVPREDVPTQILESSKSVSQNTEECEKRYSPANTEKSEPSSRESKHTSKLKTSEDHDKSMGSSVTESKNGNRRLSDYIDKPVRMTDSEDVASIPDSDIDKIHSLLDKRDDYGEKVGVETDSSKTLDVCIDSPLQKKEIPPRKKSETRVYTNRAKERMKFSDDDIDEFMEDEIEEPDKISDDVSGSPVLKRQNSAKRKMIPSSSVVDMKLRMADEVSSDVQKSGLEEEVSSPVIQKHNAKRKAPATYSNRSKRFKVPCEDTLSGVNELSSSESLVKEDADSTSASNEIEVDLKEETDNIHLPSSDVGKEKDIGTTKGRRSSKSETVESKPVSSAPRRKSSVKEIKETTEENHNEKATSDNRRASRRGASQSLLDGSRLEEGSSKSQETKRSERKQVSRQVQIKKGSSAKIDKPKSPIRTDVKKKSKSPAKIEKEVEMKSPVSTRKVEKSRSSAKIEEEVELKSPVSTRRVEKSKIPVRAETKASEPKRSSRRNEDNQKTDTGQNSSVRTKDEPNLKPANTPGKNVPQNKSECKPISPVESRRSSRRSDVSNGKNASQDILLVPSRTSHRKRSALSSIEEVKEEKKPSKRKREDLTELDNDSQTSVSDKTDSSTLSRRTSNRKPKLVEKVNTDFVYSSRTNSPVPSKRLKEEEKTSERKLRDSPKSNKTNSPVPSGRPKENEKPLGRRLRDSPKSHRTNSQVPSKSSEEDERPSEQSLCDSPKSTRSTKSSAKSTSPAPAKQVSTTRSTKRKRTEEEVVPSPNKRVRGSSVVSTDRLTKSAASAVVMSPGRTKTRNQSTYKLLFTGVICPKEDQSFVDRLGGSVVESPDDCTVLVTDKVRRTYKFLCIMGVGKPIVSLEWLKKSRQSGSFLDPWEFIVKDSEAEKKFKFSLLDSLKAASKKPLLSGYSILVTGNVKPPPQEMKGIITSCGGKILARNPGNSWPDKSFIISCAEDKSQWKNLSKGKKPIVGAEVLLLGVLQQKLDLKAHILQ